jgi:hypothetical protein
MLELFEQSGHKTRLFAFGPQRPTWSLGRILVCVDESFTSPLRWFRIKRGTAV